MTLTSMDGESPRLAIVGLGPADLEAVPQRALQLLRDAGRKVFVRTLQHPAAGALGRQRPVASCDHLYDSADDLDQVYSAIADLVMAATEEGPVVYAVPGSPHVGERSVSEIRRRAESRGVAVEVVSGGSFLDLVWAAVGADVITDGVQILDGRNLPDPLPLHLPTVITQVDRPLVLAEAVAVLGKVLPGSTTVTILDRLGDEDEIVEPMSLAEAARYSPGPRTSLFVDPPPAGWHGLVATNRRLRSECPWDREQTHHSLLRHLIEEAYETVDAITALPAEAPRGEPDYTAYAHLEEELGDLLLQVVFHATLAAETGAFDVEEVAEGIRRKLVARHPHVFGDVEAHDAETVLANWEQLKQREKDRSSLLDGVPRALPATARADKLQRRAASVGFDWPSLEPVVAKLDEEMEELRSAGADAGLAAWEMGDVLFAVINVARHVGVDPETALRMANERFEQRFRAMEAAAATDGLALSEMTLEELDALWEQAKTRLASADRTTRAAPDT